MNIIENPSPWPAELIFKPGVHFNMVALQLLPAKPLIIKKEFAHLSNPPSVGH